MRNSKGEEVTRPIVRIEIDGRPLIFTRINPESKSTSVLLRPRPNWRVLKDYLSGLEDVRQGLPRKIRSVHGQCHSHLLHLILVVPLGLPASCHVFFVQAMCNKAHYNSA